MSANNINNGYVRPAFTGILEDIENEADMNLWADDFDWGYDAIEALIKKRKAAAVLQRTLEMEMERHREDVERLQAVIEQTRPVIQSKTES